MPMLLPSTGLRLPEGDWDTFGPQVPNVPAMLPLARQVQAPPVEVTATPPKYDDPYGPLVLAARKRLEDMRAQPEQSFYSPEQAEEDKRREALGMLGAISADPNLRNVGGMVLKQALGKRDPIYREHGVVDPSTGKFRMFPQYEQAQQQNDIEKLEQLQAAGLKDWRSDQESAANRAALQQERLAQQKELAEERASNQKDRQSQVDEYRKLGVSNQLATRFDAETKDIETELSSAQKIDTMMEGAKFERRPLNAVERSSLIVLLNKIQDPPSVVREAEYDRAAALESIIGRAQNAIARLQTGQPISDKLVGEIHSLSKFYQTQSQKRLQGIGNKYHATATRHGLEPLDVVRSFYYNWDQAGQGAPGAPQPPGVRPPVPPAAAPPAMGTPQNPASLERRQNDRRTRAQGTIQWNE